MPRQESFIDKTISWADTLMRNKTVIALLLLFDGVMFFINPQMGVNGLAQGVAISVAIAAVTVLIGAITEKTKIQGTWITLGVAVLTLGISIAAFLWPALPGALLIHLLALAMVVNGVTNLLQSLRLEKAMQTGDRLQKIFSSAQEDLKDRMSETEISKSLEQSVSEQFSRRLNPLDSLLAKASVHSVIAIILNLISIIGGVLILVFHNQIGTEMLMRLCGLAMFISAATDLWVTFRAYWLRRKSKGNQTV